MNIFKVSILVDYDGRQKPVGYFKCNTPEEAAYNASLQEKDHNLDGYYEVEIIQINELFIEVPDKITYNRKSSCQNTYTIKFITKEKIIKDFENKLQSAGITVEQIREYLERK